MSKNVDPELMVAAVSFASDEFQVKQGLQLPSDHRIVRMHPDKFVRHALGEDALAHRRHEIELEAEQRRERQRRELREARIRMGAKADPSDDVNAEAVKSAVRMSDGALELVHDTETGQVLGARPKKGATVLPR